MKQKITFPYKFSWTLLKQALVLLGLLTPVLAQAQSTTVVISEIYGGGGAGTSAYQNDFVELYNKTGAPITLTNYSLQYRAATGGGAYAVADLNNATIPANGFLLVQFGVTGAAGAPLPTPDVIAADVTINLNAAGGRIALVSNNTALTSNPSPSGPGIVDFVGYGTSAITYEGADRAVAHSNTSSTERKAFEGSSSSSMGASGPDATIGNGYDSNDNQRDFVGRAVPEPQNASSAPEVPIATAVFYNTKNPAGTLDNLATYSSTRDGNGPSPTSFDGNYQAFLISGTNRTLAANWAVTGTGSRAVLQADASFTIPVAYSYTGTIDLNFGATLLDLNPAQSVGFGFLDAGSTVEFAQTSAYTVPTPASPGYGNLTLRNATKRLSAGDTFVQGNLLVDNVGASGSDVFGGAPGAASTLSLRGNLTLQRTVNFSAGGDDRIAVVLTNPLTEQVLNGGGNAIKLFRLSTLANPSNAAAALIDARLADGTSNLELGNTQTAGGGYDLAGSTVLAVGNNTLSFVANGQNTIGEGTGQLDLTSNSNLIFRKNGPVGLGALRLTAGSTQLNNLTVDAQGGGGPTAVANSLALGANVASFAVNGTLTLANGGLTIGNNVLTLNGPVQAAATGFIRGAAAARLVIAGAGSLSALNFGGTGLSSLTLNRVGATLALGTNLTVNAALTLTNGILSIGAHILNLNGTIASTTTGLLSGTTSSDLLIEGSGPLGSIAFAQSLGVLRTLNLNRPGGTLTVTSTPLQVTNTTLTNGILSLGTNVSLTIAGVLTVIDPAVALFAGTPTSSLNFTGSGAIGPLAFVNGQNVLQALSLARTSGAVPTAELRTSLTVNSLTLTRGRIFAPDLTTKLIVIPGGSVSAGGINGYTNTLTLASITNFTTERVSLAFPLGVNDQVRPLTFTVTDQVIGTTSYTARQYEAPSPARTLPPTLVRVSRIRYYSVVRESGTSTLKEASIRLSYVAANDGVTTANARQLRVAMTDPADNTRWKDTGGEGDGTGITSSTFPDGPLGDFTLATDQDTPPTANPLPVELARFDAARQGSNVAVNWATASEKNSAHFEVQRSLNGREFTTVATVAAQGNSTQLSAYTALDKSAPNGVLYYRLRQVDRDGTVAYSPAVTVSGSGLTTKVLLYPNPAKSYVSFQADAPTPYRVFNQVGQTLLRGTTQAGTATVQVSTLPVGLYFLEMQTPAGRVVQRFEKE
ncbi:MAG TPA: lamin tail domain-containing protein [Hymenobacter sp.]